MTSGAGFEFYSGTGGAFGFHWDGAEPLGAAERRLFCWHGSLKEYTASSLDLRQKRPALLPRNASFIIAAAERE